jgi:hypothetical protein
MKQPRLQQVPRIAWNKDTDVEWFLYQEEIDYQLCPYRLLSGRRKKICHT